MTDQAQHLWNLFQRRGAIDDEALDSDGQSRADGRDAVREAAARTSVALLTDVDVDDDAIGVGRPREHTRDRRDGGGVKRRVRRARSRCA